MKDQPQGRLWTKFHLRNINNRRKNSENTQISEIYV